MVFFTGEIVLHPGMENPTIVVITDRNDLDDQLFGTFSRCHEILRQKPVQTLDREHLKKLLAVGSGGIVFTTIQKFFPEKKGGKYPALSDRRNIIVITDEANRSQYDFIDGFARHIRDALPGATFIGFTGTPIELTDKNTRHVFGNYINIYDIQRAVEDKATDHPDRKDIVDHYEKRHQAIDGKAMIVCMSWRICVDLYNAIIRIQPGWHGDDDDKGTLKVIMTGSASDEETWQQHIRNKPRREVLAKRFQKARNDDDPLKIAIVRDMWLTGFDVPSLHTMHTENQCRGIP